MVQKNNMAQSHIWEKLGKGISFLLARLRVTPKKQLSVPRLKLCATLCVPQLAEVLRIELTLDHCPPTIMLNWLHFGSCRLKAFPSTRIAEIHEITALMVAMVSDQCYADSANNPTDDLIKGFRC